jgi:gluconolactonase
VVKSDDTIWFTDPSYGIMSDYEGYKGEREQGGCYVFRFDPRTNDLGIVADDFTMPNGLAFSPDESILDVAESGASHWPDVPPAIRAFKVGDDGNLWSGREFCRTTSGYPDGFRVDTDGNVWTSAGPGIECFNPAGEPMGRIGFPQTVSNLTFGGQKRNRLFVTCTHELYAMYVAATGAQRP